MCGGSAPRGSVSRGSRILVDDAAAAAAADVDIPEWFVEVVDVFGSIMFVDGEVCGDAGGEEEVQRDVRPLPPSGDPKEELMSSSMAAWRGGGGRLGWRSR